MHYMADEQIILERHPILAGFWHAFQVIRQDGSKIHFRLGDKVKSSRFLLPGGTLQIIKIIVRNAQPYVELMAGETVILADPTEIKGLHPLEQLAAEAE